MQRSFIAAVVIRRPLAVQSPSSYPGISRRLSLLRVASAAGASAAAVLGLAVASMQLGSMAGHKLRLVACFPE